MKKITLAHGAGGSKSRELIEEIFLPRFGNAELSKLSDGAVLDLEGGKHVLTTDTHVVDPIFFSGGDIGKLAVCGTVNDLVVSGARPRWMSCGFVLEEGFDIGELERIVDSMGLAASAARVAIVAGDTKVVGPGQADKVYINTTGLGEVVAGYEVKELAAGDKVLVTGAVGQHGSAIFNDREGLLENSRLMSDCASLDWMVAVVAEFAGAIKMMRDPTRGGLGVVVNEMLAGSACGAELEDEALPVTAETQSLCELVGFDAYYLPCEGRAVIVAAAEAAGELLKALTECEAGRDSAVIGELLTDERRRVRVRTAAGGQRLLGGSGEIMLPRIC